MNTPHLAALEPVPLRPPDEVMRLARIGSFHQTRLSFLRSLMRRLRREQWRFERTLWRVDNVGVGVAVYTARGLDRTYSLIAFAHDLDPAKRSDRVIAEEWDATFTLFDGEPTEDDIKRLRSQVPKQEAGRVAGKELTLSRANRSVRLFEHVRDCLAQGRQPDQADLESVGYLMRTTAVYGSGKFGALDRRFIANRPEFGAPFQVELLTVYLIRVFTVDIVEHLAAVQSPQSAVRLAPELKRCLGVGNSTGLGMAPFIVNHPALLHQWIVARETALARVRGMPTIEERTVAQLRDILRRQQLGLPYWRTDHPAQAQRVTQLVDDLERLSTYIDSLALTAIPQPLDRIYRWAAEHLSLEGQEYVVTLLIEPFGELVDDLSDAMSVDEQAVFAIDGRQRICELNELLSRRYRFAQEMDFSSDSANARFWYASEEKLEPRLGERFSEEGAEREHPLATARDISQLMQLSAQFPDDTPVAELLLKFPECRHAVRRAQVSDKHPYAEIHDNLIADTVVPLDLLRCKLSFFGANRFDPRSDRWIRITLFQYAPFPDEIAGDETGDQWIYPPLDGAADVGRVT